VFNHFPKYHVEILFRYFNAKLGRDDIFKLTVGNQSSHQDSIDNVVGVLHSCHIKKHC
jgi:hypothetical protein